MLTQSILLVIAISIHNPDVIDARLRLNSRALQPVRSVLQEPAALQMAGEQVIHALQVKDVQLLASMVDSAGIILGMDSPKIQASVFKRELGRKRGVYCDLFGCPKTANSLHSMIKGKTIKIHSRLSRDFPGTGQADALEALAGNRSADNSQSPLFTLFFTFRHGKWYLQQIEYT